MAIRDPDMAAEFRRDESWLFSTTAGAYIRKAAISLLTLIVFAFVLFPLYQVVVTASKTTAEIQQIPPTVFPNDFSLEGFRFIVESSVQADNYTLLSVNLFGQQASSTIDIDILSLVLNSLKVAINTGAIALVFGTATSYVLSRRDFTGKNTLMSIFPASLMFPGTAIMVPRWELVSALGLFSTYLVLIFTYGVMTALFVVWLMKDFFDDFPDSVIGTSRIDQCSSIETFWCVIVPMARNSLVTSFIFAFLPAWNELVFALTLLDNSRYTVPPELLTFVQGFDTQWNVVTAASIIISLPVLLGLAYTQRYSVRGLTGNVIKG